MKQRNGIWIALACATSLTVHAAEPAPPAASQAAPAAADATAAPAAPTRNPRAAPDPRGAGRAVDRLELDATQITGNRELPKVMVVVPWKKSDIGDLVGKPVNSLVDEALQPVDREVFRREVAYYGALGPDRPREATPAGANPVTDANAQRGEAASATRAEN